MKLSSALISQRFLNQNQNQNQNQRRTRTRRTKDPEPEPEPEPEAPEPEPEVEPEPEPEAQEPGSDWEYSREAPEYCWQEQTTLFGGMNVRIWFVYWNGQQMVPDQVNRPLGTAWPTTLTVDGQTFTREDTVFSSENPTTQYGTQTIGLLPFEVYATSTDSNESNTTSRTRPIARVARRRWRK